MVRVAAYCAVLLLSFTQLVEGAERKLKIVTTFAPAYSLAASIAGDKAEVANLLPANASLHEYTLSPRDMQKLNSAEVLVMNGAGLETWLAKALRTVEKKPGLRIVQLASGLEKELIHAEHAEEHHDHKHDHGDYNPHLWLDPILLIQSSSNLVTAISAKDPGNAEAYKANGAALIQRLTALHADYERDLQKVKNVAFLTYHSAFPYLARRYGLALAGVVEEVPEVSPSPRQLKSLYNLIKSRQVKVLFTEPGFRTRLANQIARDGKVALAELDPFETGELSADSYEKVMRNNLKNLVEALGK